MIFSVCLCLALIGNTQEDLKPKVSIEKIEALYRKWDNLKKPGIAVGIISNGEIVHAKAYGLANLEYGIPVTTKTKFYIGKIANQFTVLGLLLLESEGKLSLNDTLGKYFPKLSNLDSSITIVDLIQHSSGLYDVTVSKALAGWQEEALTPQQAIRFLTIGQSTYTIDNKRFQTNHSAFLLLENIIAKVAGISYSQFVTQRILEPLQMTKTVFDDFAGKVIDNRAIGYYPTDSGYRKGHVHQYQENTTNVYSTVEDLSKWEQNFLSSRPKVGTVAMFKKMDTPIALNGKPLPKRNYALYFGQLQYWDYYGTRKMYNASVASGFSCKVIRYPDYHLSVVVMGNDGVYNGSTATRTSRLFVEPYFTKKPTPRRHVKIEEVKMDTKALEKFVGDYWESNELYKRHIYLQNDTLRYARGFGNDSPIIPIGDNSFQMLTYDNIYLRFTRKGNQKVMSVEAPVGTFEHISFNPHAPWTKKLNDFTGRYYCQELDITYHLSINDNVLTIKNPRVGNILLLPIFEDNFTSNRPYFNELKFSRVIDKGVIGFHLSSATGERFWFQK